VVADVVEHGETLRACGRPEEAVGHLEQALELAQALGQAHDQGRADPEPYFRKIMVNTYTT
jgi:hypothetical protein